MKFYKNIIVIICFFVFACVKVAWAQVVSGTTYNTPYETGLPTGWSGYTYNQSDGTYAQLTKPGHYIKTSNFCQKGFSSIVLKARKHGGPASGQEVITVSWYDASTTAVTVLGTVIPTSNELTNYTISSPTNPTSNTEGYIKITCPGNNGTRGSGVSQVTINYTSCADSHTLSSAVDPDASGTVVLGATSVPEGSTTTATATPNLGYAFDHWTVSGAGSSLSSTTTNPTTFTMGTANATVTAYFTALPAYSVTFNAGTGTCATTSLTESVGGEGVVLPEATAPAGCDPEYSFYGWSETSISETASAPTIVGSTGDTYYPAANITLYAVYVAGGTSYSSNPSCSCPAPSDFSVSGITSATANLTWTANGTESQWQVVLSETDLDDPSTGTINVSSTTSYAATGLTPLTTYYAYMRAKCADDDFSSWRELSFTTTCVDWGDDYAINITSASLQPSDVLNLSVSGNTSGRDVQWTTSNSSVATVSSEGLVTAVADGYCVISATVPADGTSCGKTVTCNIAVSSDACNRVGWGTTKGIGTYTAYNHSYVQQLYLAEEIRMAGGVAGMITSIKVHHSGSQTVSSTVFLGLTSRTDLESGWVTTGLQQVASGDINYTDGWTEIDITDFEWDGESNIVVAFQNTSGTGANCYTHLLGNQGYTQSFTYNYRSYSSSSAIEYESGLPTVDGTESAYRTNMKFCITECPNPVDAYFSASEVNLIYAETVNLALMLTVNPSGGTVTWTSDNTTVATVDASGVVTAGSTEGSATISVHVAQTDRGNCSANASITVKVCNCNSGETLYKIGEGTSGSCNYEPINAAYNYSYRQIIYPVDELTVGTIKSVAFYYSYSLALTQKTNVDIYMGITTKTAFATYSTADWVPLSDLTLVYSGVFNCSQGWNSFDLSVPFQYTGCGNLVVAINDKSGEYDNYYQSTYFYCSNSSNKVQLYSRNDDNPYNELPTNANGITTSYPNVRFCIEEGGTTTHTLTYDVNGNCDGGTVSPASISGTTAAYAEVTSTIPSCTEYAGFKEWNTASDGSGTAYNAGDRIILSCDDITLYAIYDNVVQGESSCENAVAFCGSSNSLSFAVSEGYGESYGNFCAFFNTPGTWWYMQIAEAGDLYMTIASSAGDVDIACWGPFDNMTCDLADLSDNGANGWYHYSNDESNASKHYINSNDTPTVSVNNPVCGDVTLARPSGNLVDFGGSTSEEEYLQIVGAQPGEYYMILVANYANADGAITFTQTGGAGRASCDIVSNCAITSISAETECTSSSLYKVSGSVAFRDAPVDGTLVVAVGANTDTINPPFSSPMYYEITDLTPNGSSTTITATFTSSTVNCSKVSAFTAPSKSYCEDVILPITLVSLRGECNGKRALISWATVSERNNNYFVVERSDDAVNFVEVGRVAGAGNSMQMLSYSYADYGISLGDNYYRLVQVDYDGTRTISEIIEVNCSGNAPEGDPDVYVYPNPFNNELTVHLVNFDDQPARIQVYDMLGRLLFERSASPTYNDAEIVLHLDDLPSAAYYVRVSASDFVVNKKVVKNN